MSKRIITTILLATLLSPLFAQSSWTMDDCIRYAVNRSIEVSRAQAEVGNARTDFHQTVADFLPSVGASVNGQYSWGRNVDPETNTYNTITTFNNYYQLYAELSVFDGGAAIGAFRQAKAQLQQSMTAVQKAKDDKAAEVMQKYVDAIYTQACVRLADAKLADSRQLLAKTQRQMELGMKGYPEVVQMEAQVAEEEYNLVHQKNLHATAVRTLKSAMGYPVTDSLRLAAETEELMRRSPHAAPLSSPDKVVSAALLTNPVALTAEHAVRDARYSHQIAKAHLLPAISLSAGIATSYFRNLTSGLQTTPFHRQWHDNMGEYVAATMSIPLFRYSLHRNVRRARNAMLIAQLNRDETVRRLHDDVYQAVADCEGYQQEVAQLERKVEADSLAYRLSTRKYEEGMLSAYELRTAGNTLLQSRTQLLQSRMLHAIKRRLVEYYENGKLY